MIAHVFLGRKAETFAVQGPLLSSRDRSTSVNGAAREPVGTVEPGRRRRREARPESVRWSRPPAALRHLRRDGFDGLGKVAPFWGVSVIQIKRAERNPNWRVRSGISLKYRPKKIRNP